MSDTFSIGENVFALFNDRTVVAECRVIDIKRHSPFHDVLVVEAHNDSDAIRGRYVRIAGAGDVFRSRAAAFRAVAQKWATIRDVAEANRARAVDQSIA